MKVFVSWSGDLSCKMAGILKNWLPCIMQSVEVFFSKDDIEKGDNWDRTISSNLSECKYGIICLTPDNINAPWVNFEAGAIAKTLDSKVTALMVGIKPSDIQGPLARYQATKLEKEDFFQLVISINSLLETPLDDKILKTTFEAIWGSMETEINKIIEGNKRESVIKKENKNPGQTTSETIEEMLQLLRKQNSLLSNPENIFPKEYISMLFNQHSETSEEVIFWDEIYEYVKRAREKMSVIAGDGKGQNSEICEELWRVIFRYARGRRKKQVCNMIDRFLSELQMFRIGSYRPKVSAIIERRQENGGVNKELEQDALLAELYGIDFEDINKGK